MPRTSNGTTLSQQQIDPSILNDYLKTIDDRGLTQAVQESTKHENIIDQVLTNDNYIINDARVIPGISDHDMLLFEANLAPRKEKPVKRKFNIKLHKEERRYHTY